MKQKEPHGLPPCSLSAQCLRLLDELDSSNDSLLFMDDTRDEYLLERLREHIPTCPSCTATVAQARHIRAQQRAALRDLLADSEQRVPSTTSQIFAALHKNVILRGGEGTEHQANADLLDLPFEETNITPQPEQLNGWHSSSVPLSSLSRPRVILKNILTLAAVAALILASVALFGHLVVMRSHPSTSTTPISPTKIAQQPTGAAPRTTPPPAPSASPSSVSSAPAVGKTSTPAPISNGWNSVMITSSTASGQVISNYNYQSGARVQLTNQQLPANTQFDGISPDGQNLLYQYTESDQTMYFTLSQSSNASFFYSMDDDNAGNAIWLDGRNVLIATHNNGVVEVDALTGQSQPVLPNLNNAMLKFVHNGFLYFAGGQSRNIGALYRVNIATRVVQLLTYRSLGGSFLLSPDGSTIYFKTNGSAGLPGIYAVNSNGTNARMLPENGVPIGYAADNSLMIMQQGANGNFEVVKLGSAPSQDQVISANVAPGAISICTQSTPPGVVPICDNAVALAPYGHALVVQASYSDGSRQVLSLDLTTGNRVTLQVPSGSTDVLLGWDKLPVG
jgi:hypothetical protein